MKIQLETLRHVLTKALGTAVLNADYQTERLHGGTLGDVQLVTGVAETADSGALPYRLVLKTQRRWERYGDPDSWRREYDRYRSDLGSTFSESFRWPTCYHAELRDDETQIWLEYLEGKSGLGLTGAMCERAAEELGRFQGRIYAEKPTALESLANLSRVDFLRNNYLRYRSRNELYDYIRTDSCEIPRHLCQMLIDIDEDADQVFGRIERLPIVLCHRDFWVANFFYSAGQIVLIDWDTAGWGYLGEDIASLIADEADVEQMVAHFRRCVPAYCRGFSEYADASPLSYDSVRELILLSFGYRLVEWYRFAKSPERKALHLSTLEQIHQMRDVSKNH